MNKCGVLEMNITPPLGTHIPGHFSDRFSTGIKDHLYVKAMVIEDDKTVIALLSIDALNVHQTFVQKIRERIRERIDIPSENIMVSATHTHTGGPRIPRKFDAPLDADTVDFFHHMVKKAADAVIIAFNNRQEARIGVGTGSESSIAFNRRYFMKDGSVKTNPGINNPDIVEAEGPIDPEVLVLRVDDLNGQPLGVFVNYACHTDVVKGTEYSADYPGEVSRTLKKVLGENIVCLFGLGACGNINHTDIYQTTNTRHQEHYKKMGRILAGEVLAVREKIETSETLQLKANQHILSIPNRQPTSQEMEEARQLIRAPEGKNGMEVGTAKRTITLADDIELKQSSDIEIQVMKIGESAIVGIPCELFVEYGLEIKRESVTKHTIINTLTNGSHSYVPTKEALPRGGYETIVANNRLVADAGKQMVSTALDLIKSI